MNPLKWAVWVRVGGVVSIIYGILTYVYNRDFSPEYWEENFLIGLSPLAIFWLGAWIYHGIKQKDK